MTGLILKDLLVLRKVFRSYVLVLAVYVALTFTGMWSPEFLGGFAMLMVAMAPMNLFAYDKQAQWDTYALALPTGRGKTVAARYGVVLLLTLASFAVMAALGGVIAALGRMEEPGPYLLTCAVCGFLAVLMNAILLPLLYKFGPERGRIMLFAAMGAISLAVGVLLFPMGGLNWLMSLEEPTFAQLLPLPIIAAVAGLLLLALSFLLSRHFYGQKDV